MQHRPRVGPGLLGLLIMLGYGTVMGSFFTYLVMAGSCNG